MRRALVVGINDYPTSPLRGCVNDARDWAAVLTERGYEVDLRLDRAASKTGILQGLYNLVEGASLGSRLVFTYSGHGTYVPDRDGDETDRRDEALVGADMRLLTDDELHRVVGDLPRGARLTIVSDSCHSGTMTRSLDPEVRFLHPETLGIDAGDDEDRPRDRAPRPDAILLAGCKDDEVSYDALIDGRWRGALTAAALKALPESRNYGVWGRLTRKYITHPQTPQLTATDYQRRQSPLP